MRTMKLKNLLIFIFLSISINSIAQSKPTPQTVKTIRDALNERFLDYTENSCHIVPWVTVKQEKALKYKDSDKAEAPNVVPNTFIAPWDPTQLIAVQRKDLTISAVTEKVYTDAEKNDFSTFVKSDDLIILDNNNPIPNISQANASHSLAYYSHSCDYLIQLGMNSKGGFTLPFASLQASYQAAASGETKGNLVMIGGTFPSRLAVLLLDTPQTKLYAAASLWDWY